MKMSERKMRAARVLVATTAGACVVGAVAVGCFNAAGDCEVTFTCPPDMESSTSSGPPVPPSGTCVPSESSDAVADECGIFVSSSLGQNTGTGLGSKAHPFKTLGAALAAAGGKPVYACGEMFAESVAISVPVTLYGGLDCSKGWVYNATKRTRLTAGADEIPLTLANTASGTEVSDFAITAASATKAGGSSIGVLVHQAAASLSRCSVIAGDAMNGAAGESGGPKEAQATSGAQGGYAGEAGKGSVVGGPGGYNSACTVIGGNGGNGSAAEHADAGDGTQGDGKQGGKGGKGGKWYYGWPVDYSSPCSQGLSGDKGPAGPSGGGAMGMGMLDKGGFHGVDGEPGKEGTPGKSGGGGGGSVAIDVVHGAGGGGGGAGGCGGTRGGGGKAGGSSIALVSLEASLTLKSCMLTAGTGGRGGDGGDGQPGQAGGLGGGGGDAAVEDQKGCDGGMGGNGGDGGNGGGGLGGHSLGIAFVGSAPAFDQVSLGAITHGTHGKGGLGGHMDVKVNHGGDGLAAKCWDFGQNKLCPP